MSNRPRNYREALDFINGRKDRSQAERVISRSSRDYRSGQKFSPSRVVDQLIAHTDDPLSTYSDNPPPISFRQWDTDIATFYSDGSIAARPWDSPTTRDRMNDMNLPFVRSTQSMGLTLNQSARLWYTGRFAIKGFRYGVPADRTYLLNSDRTLSSQEDEPTETIYVESTPGVHAAYNLGRRRLLKVLKEYQDMMVAMDVGSPLWAFGFNESARSALVDMCLSSLSAQQLRDEWLPSVLRYTSPAVAAAYYRAAKEQLGLNNLTNKRELWAQKQVPSRELDQWL
jgi:hypothetical protein